MMRIILIVFFVFLFVNPFAQTCKKNFSKLCFINTQTVDKHTGNSINEIRIGQGMVFSWNTPRNVYIPTNRKGWAIGMAVAHTLFCNLIGFQAISINEYLATTLQEVNCGCVGGITAPAWVTAPYPIAPTKYYCFDYSHAYAAGYFQEEFPTFGQLRSDIPCFPTFNFDTLVVGGHFETQALVKAYQDFDNVIFWQTKCYNPIGFMRNAKDPYAAEKIISSGYNSGVWSPVVSTILTTNRTAALSATNIGPILDTTSVYNYWEQISRVTAVLDSNLSDVSATDAANHSVTYPGVHKFRDFYDSQISWSDVSNYIDSIAPMYKSVGITAAGLKSAVQPVFNSINGGASISFRTQMPTVIDAIVLNLPAFYPTGLGTSCSNAKATMSVSDTVCPGQPLVLKLTLSGTSPWSVIYGKPDGTSQTINNITTSPYSFNVTDTGTYHLISVFDKNGVGSIVCAPIVKAYFKGSMANWNTSNVSGGCATGDLKLNLTGTGDWVVYYNIKGGSTQSVIIPANTTSPYTLITNPAKGDEYTITRVVSGGCDVTMNSSIKVCSACSKPTVSISAIPPLCEGNTLSFNTNVIYNGGATSATYNWVGANNFVSTDKNPLATNIVPIMTGNYTVTVTDNLLCSQTASVSVTVNAKPLINPGINQSVCSGKSILLSATGGNSYSWNNGVTQGVSFIPATTATYTVTGTDNNNCSNTASVIVTMNNLPALTTIGDTICNGDIASISASGANTYAWSNNLGSGNSKTVNPLISMTYTVTGTDINNCSNTANVIVKVNNLPSVTAIGDTICDGEVASISASGANTYAWSNNLGSGNSKTVNPLKSITYTVTGTDNNKCSNTANAIVILYSPSTFSTFGDTICYGETATISASGAKTYVWSNNLGSGNSKTVNPFASVTYTVTGTYNNKCSNSAYVVVRVNGLPVVSATGNTICEGENTSISARGAITYVWSNNLGNGNSKTVNPNSKTTYTVTGTDANFCSNTANAIVIVYDLPDVIAKGGSICNGKAITISVSGAKSYIWSHGLGNGDSKTVNPISTSTYTVTGKDNNNCSNSDNAIVIVNDSIKAGISVVSDKVIANNPVQFTDKSVNASSWKWNFGDGSNLSSEQNPLHVFNRDGDFIVTLLVSSSKNCQEDTTLVIHVTAAPSIFVPSAFSPNKDGINDVFLILGEFKTMDIQIFNQWGLQVFSSQSQNLGWDGTYKGIDQPEGNYTFVIRIVNKVGYEVYMNGMITLLR